MRIALARPFQGHAADDVVDLDDATARRLIGDGKARRPTARDEARVAAQTAVEAVDGETDSTPAKPGGSGRRTRKEK